MKVSYYSLGCKVNEYESVAIINEFIDNGFELVNFNSKADVYIINTCTVTATADSKSRKIIRKATKTNEDAVVAIMGCYSQLNPKQIEDIPGVDIVLGTNNRHLLFNYVMDALNNKNKVFAIEKPSSSWEYEELKVNIFNNQTRGFIKIQDGCNNFCSYCAIPYARGRVRSRLASDVNEEIKLLANDGMKEVVLTGINTGAYGTDLNNYLLSDLLQELINKVDNLPRIRISSIEVTEVNDNLLNLIKENKKVFCEHLHIPLQGGTNKTLKGMNRKYTIEEYRNLIKKVRDIFPDVNITTDIMVGFPGETIEDFNETKAFLNEIAYGEMHVFPFSKRPGTKANSFENDIDQITKKIRANELLELNKVNALKYRSKFISKKLEVLVEKVVNGIAFGHSSNYINLSFPTKSAKPNEIYTVELIEANYPLSIAKEII